MCANAEAEALGSAQGTGPEIWAQTGGRVTHFVTSLGTTGTAMGTSRCAHALLMSPPPALRFALQRCAHTEAPVTPRLHSFLKSQNAAIQIAGLQPAEGAAIAGIRRWPAEYLPSIFDGTRVDRTLDITQAEAEETTRALARVEGICAGVSSGGCVAGALRIAGAPPVHALHRA